MMHPLTATKNRNKIRVGMIRVGKSNRKTVPYGVVPHLVELRHQYRLHHIAYCEVRGRVRDQIEKPGPDNKLTEGDEHNIKRIKRWLDSDIREYCGKKFKDPEKYHRHLVSLDKCKECVNQ